MYRDVGHNYRKQSMKQIFTIVILTFITITASCQKYGKSIEKNKFPDSLKVDIKSNNLYFIEDANETDFENALKKYCSHFTKDTLNYIKTDSLMKLPIENGKFVSFRDTLSWENEDIDARFYRYLGNYPEIGYYLVEGKYYENYSCILINKKSGSKKYLGGIPKISPTQNFLLNINEIGGMGDEPIGFQIWKSNKNKSNWILMDKSNNLAWQTDDKSVKTPWYPLDFIWEADKIAIMKLISLKSNDYKNNNYKDSRECVYKRLTIK